MVRPPEVHGDETAFYKVGMERKLLPPGPHPLLLHLLHICTCHGPRWGPWCLWNAERAQVGTGELWHQHKLQGASHAHGASKSPLEL